MRDRYRGKQILGETWVSYHGNHKIESCRGIIPDDVKDHPIVRGIKSGDMVGLTSRSGEIVLPADVTDRVRPGVVYTTFHFPESGANVVTTENSDWVTLTTSPPHALILSVVRLMVSVRPASDT